MSRSAEVIPAGQLPLFDEEQRQPRKQYRHERSAEELAALRTDAGRCSCDPPGLGAGGQAALSGVREGDQCSGPPLRPALVRRGAPDLGTNGG
jgi:hypothetical protein